jgi:hypothetical protein
MASIEPNTTWVDGANAAADQDLRTRLHLVAVAAIGRRR